MPAMRYVPIVLASIVVLAAGDALAASGGWLEPIVEIVVRAFLKLYVRAAEEDGSNPFLLVVGIVLAAIGILLLVSVWRSHRHRQEGDRPAKRILAGAAMSLVGAVLIVAS